MIYPKISPIIIYLKQALIKQHNYYCFKLLHQRGTIPILRQASELSVKHEPTHHAKLRVSILS